MSSMPRCCDTGRPIVVDPGTGRTVCSCNLQRGLPSYLSRVPTLPETVYGTGNNMLASIYKMYGQSPEQAALTPGLPHPAIPVSAHAIAAHPYGYGYPGFDIHGARRKNATRETTSPLKAWLYSHKKNPYPTKAEKIMLAIVTRMTLTQVSTWFANARRRLKKENRLNGKDDDCLSDISGKDDSIDVDTSSDQLSLPDCDDVSLQTGSVLDMSTPESLGQHPKRCVQKLFSPDPRNEIYLDRLSSPELLEKHSDKNTETVEISERYNINTLSRIEPENKTTHVNGESTNVINTTVKTNATDNKTNSPQEQPKPKIWSIAQMLS